MSRVEIQFNTLKQEKQRVDSVLNQLDFYKKNNYHISLPQQSVEDEYNPFQFEEKIDKITEDWQKIEGDFFINAKKVLKLDPLPTYFCFVTQYGTGGSYNPPDSLIMNIKSEHFGFYTIAHEVIHLLIHDLIEERKIDHWSKERIVDLYFYEILNVNKFQNIQDQTIIEHIDSTFYKFLLEGATKVISNI